VGLKAKLTENWRNGAIGAASAVLLGLLFLESRLGDGLKNLSYDLPFLVAPQADLAEVVIIYMDEESRDLYRQDPEKPWDRSIHAGLVRELTRRGAGAVVFDVLFSPASPDTNADWQLAQAIRQHGKVVLAATTFSSVAEGSNVVTKLTHLKPADEPIGSAAPNGVVELAVETDRVVRRHYRDERFIGLAWRAAETVGQAPPDPAADRWIRYYGDRGILPNLKYHQALDTNALAADYFSNKVVFVGLGRVITHKGPSTDEYPTPYKRWTGNLTPGVEIQATAFLNLTRNDWLRRLPAGAQMLLVVLLGVVLGYGLILLRPWVATAASLAGLVLLAAVAVLLFWKARVWFSWLTLGVVEIPVALGWAVLVNTKKVYHDVEELEKTLTRLKSGVPSSNVGPEVLNPRPGAVLNPVLNPVVAAVSDTDRTVLDPDEKPKDPTPQIPNYDLVRRIGKGAYGEVWLARDLIGSFHAIKVVYRKSFTSASPFEREFRGLQRFGPISRSHPGLVQVLYVGKDDPGGYFYYSMEMGDDVATGPQIDPATYSPRNLAKDIEKRGRIPFDECLQLALDLTAALDYLHQQKLIHRDIKPSNIIFVRGQPKIADIGLVTEVAATGHDATWIGTPGYIPPEGPGTPAADVFSLGKVLYEAAMGRTLEHFPELPDTLIERPDYKQLVQLNQIILKAAENNVSVRYKTAGQMHADLLKLQTKLKAPRKG
jgi:CHASE2 domain-containing sensor protein